MTTTTARTAPVASLRRGVAGLMPLWFWLFVLAVVGAVVVEAPSATGMVLPALFLALAFVRPPRTDHDPVGVASPVRGRWTAINSPADAVPSHGIRAYGQTYAIDVLHPSPAGAATTLGWTGGSRRPETFSSFGEPVHAVADGTVVTASSWRRDHRARTSWPAIVYLLTVESFRDLVGPGGVVGNHVVLDHGDGVFSLYAHLRRGSARVAVGDAVRAGDVLGEVGNSGNTSEPHLHVQLMDRARPLRAAGIPFRWEDATILDDTDPTRARGAVPTDVVEGLPAAGQVFEA
ncbi:M23 family metallopeptidase [Oerskovia flava]|uniref:M23 family metallopeptidase n=1 Tax=Oerskovia flava TaxID=2986422 RepID=UPI00223F2C19|nr:M23 family metallopeptidase [Oerskovia sp. JB1-3-2]